MKKFLIGAVSAVALSFAFGAAPASAASANSLCKDNNDFGFATHGECVSWINKDLIVDACKNYKATNPVAIDASFKNLGDCISQTRHLLKSL